MSVNVVTAVATSIQAVLVLVAMWYTRGQLAEARAARVASARKSDEVAVRQLVRLTASATSDLRMLVGQFDGLGQGDRWPVDRISEGQKKAGFISDELHCIAGELPFALLKQSLEAAVILQKTIQSCLLVSLVDSLTVIDLKNSSDAEDCDWSWDVARRIYLTEIREQMPSRPEWGTLLAGDAAQAAADALNTTYLTAVAWLEVNRVN